MNWKIFESFFKNILDETKVPKTLSQIHSHGPKPVKFPVLENEYDLSKPKNEGQASSKNVSLSAISVII